MRTARVSLKAEEVLAEQLAEWPHESARSDDGSVVCFVVFTTDDHASVMLALEVGLIVVGQRDDNLGWNDVRTSDLPSIEMYTSFLKS